MLQHSALMNNAAKHHRITRPSVHNLLADPSYCAGLYIHTRFCYHRLWQLSIFRSLALKRQAFSTAVRNKDQAVVVPFKQHKLAFMCTTGNGNVTNIQLPTANCDVSTFIPCECTGIEWLYLEFKSLKYTCSPVLLYGLCKFRKSC